MKEIWKPIEGYEGLYEVSNFGRVRSLDHFETNGVCVILYKGKNIVGSVSKHGYHVVSLCKHGVQKSFKTHRIVAKTFIPNPKNYPCVNHKDQNRLNNFVDNLEWCTYSYNNLSINKKTGAFHPAPK